MKVEKELVDVFHLRTDDMMMLNQIIQKAFRCNENDPNFERMREYRVFFTSRKSCFGTRIGLRIIGGNSVPNPRSSCKNNVIRKLRMDIQHFFIGSGISMIIVPIY